MADARQICDELQLARSLLRELIDLLQVHDPGQTPTLFLPILVHLANIHKLVEASGEPSNAIKRLRDFAQTIEKRKLRDGGTAEIEAVRVRLVETLRGAADHLNTARAATDDAADLSVAATS